LQADKQTTVTMLLAGLHVLDKKK